VVGEHGDEQHSQEIDGKISNQEESQIADFALYVAMLLLSVRSTNVGKQKHGNVQRKVRDLGFFLIRDFAINFLGVLFITMFSNHQLRNDPLFNVYSIIFEVVSAYGTVGLSLGYGNDVTSFSGRFNPWSKFVVIVIMMAGRHRYLASSLDPAINGGFDPVRRQKWAAKKKKRRAERKRALQALSDEFPF